jgi:hypothetical protein
VREERTAGDAMKHYRINKVTKPGGTVLKKQDVLAVSDQAALQRAEDSPDCPTCDVLHNGEHIGSIVAVNGRPTTRR